MTEQARTDLPGELARIADALVAGRHVLRDEGRGMRDEDGGMQDGSAENGTPHPSSFIPLPFKERIVQYMQKATREAKVHTSWINPDERMPLGVETWGETRLLLPPELAGAPLTDLLTGQTVAAGRDKPGLDLAAVFAHLPVALLLRAG